MCDCEHPVECVQNGECGWCNALDSYHTADSRMRALQEQLGKQALIISGDNVHLYTDQPIGLLTILGGSLYIGSALRATDHHENRRTFEN